MAKRSLLSERPSYIWIRCFGLRLGENFEVNMGTGLHEKHSVRRGFWQTTQQFSVGPRKKIMVHLDHVGLGSQDLPKAY